MKILCIISFILLLFFIFKKSKGMGSMYNGILVGGLVYYGIVPLLNEIFKGEKHYKISYYLNYEAYKYAITYFYIILFFFIFYISNKTYFFKREYTYVPNEVKLNKNLKFVGYFCFSVGGISLILFFGALGGLSNALTVAEKARSFAISLTDYMPYYASLLVIPARLVMVAPYCFWVLQYLNEGKGEKYGTLKIISYILTVLFCLFNAGRAPILAMLLCLIVPILLNLNVKHAWTLIFIIGIFSLPILDVLDQLFVYFQKGTFKFEKFDYISYLNQFSYPINNVFHAFDIGHEYGFRWGKDFITVILDFIPGFYFEPSYVPTSRFIGGVDWRITGGTPNDLITLSIFEFHFLGLIIIPLVLGKISKLTDEILFSFNDKRIARVLSTVIAVYSFLMVSNADPYSIFRAFILWMIVLVVLVSKTKKPLKRGTN